MMTVLKNVKLFRYAFMIGIIVGIIVGLVSIVTLAVLSGCNLSAEGTSFDAVRNWTAPADNIGVIAYDGRYAADSMDLINDWDNCTIMLNMPAPSPPGTPENYTCILPGGSWHIAIKSRDAAGNWSAISNIQHYINDTESPVAINDLR
jgi:hypothetical protein